MKNDGKAGPKSLRDDQRCVAKSRARDFGEDDELVERLKNCSTIPKNPSILTRLPASLIVEVIQHVDQFDLVNLVQTCSGMYSIGMDRLYKRVTVILNAEFPLRYDNDGHSFIRENGIRHMDTSLVLRINNLLKFMDSLRLNPSLVQKVKFFVFDKCYADNLLKQDYDLNVIQSGIIDFFGEVSHEMNFLHITFVDFVNGIERLTLFLQNENIRNKIFKLFVTRAKDLYTPVVPQGLTNLFLMLEELELMEMDSFDLLNPPFELFNSLFTLTCSTTHQFGLEVLRKMKLMSENDDSTKLKLKGFTTFHCHKESITSDEMGAFAAHSTADREEEFQDYIKRMDKRLLFKVISDKIDLTYLTHLYFKIDCNVHRSYNCECFPTFFKDLTAYLVARHGLPNLISFELELFLNFEWLRPHQILESILTPLGSFIKTLHSLSRLSIDLATLGFKMFDNVIGMSSVLLNKLNERLIEAFFLCFFTSSHLTIAHNLKTLQLPDFLTSFIYYKSDFYESLLHTCQCWGCKLVLDKLKELFLPLGDEEEFEDTNEEASYYTLIGFILGKLQTDREVCIPIKQKTFNYKHYPIYKGQPHTLHKHFHDNRSCCCNIDEDPHGDSKMAIDNLVTTYVIHQLRPIMKYLTTIFSNLENLMIHGIYYEIDKHGIIKPIFDADEYPPEFLEEVECEIQFEIRPDLPFGYFRSK